MKRGGSNHEFERGLNREAGIIDGWLLLLAVAQDDMLNSYEDAVAFAHTGKYKLRNKKSEEKQKVVARAKALQEQKVTYLEMSKLLGIPETTIANWKKKKWHIHGNI